jgi:ketosteroid isomerase-like protein
MPATLNRKLVTAVALALTACAPPVTVNQQSEEAAIRAAGQDWQQAVIAKDVDRIVAHFAPDVIIMTPNAPVTRGIDAARKLWADEVALPGLAVSWVPNEIEITSPTTAVEMGTYRFAFDSPTGRVNDAGSYISHWRKIDGRWRMTRDAIVSSTPTATGDPLAALGIDTTSMELRPNSSLTWTDLVVPGFPPGGKRAVLHGNPAGTGDYVLRLQFPDGFQVPVHWHPKAEHVTVLSGRFNMGTGATRDVSQMRTYVPGDFFFLPPRNPHFASADGVVTLQLHGIAPFQVIVGAP